MHLGECVRLDLARTGELTEGPAAPARSPRGAPLPRAGELAEGAAAPTRPPLFRTGELAKDLLLLCGRRSPTREARSTVPVWIRPLPTRTRRRATAACAWGSAGSSVAALYPLPRQGCGRVVAPPSEVSRAGRRSLCQ
jgi:hypothetical protein